jgi:hypothetical protein
VIKMTDPDALDACVDVDATRALRARLTSECAEPADGGGT